MTSAECTEVVLAGGWGYDNLGDEAILAGYLEWLTATGVSPSVLSVDPGRTRAAQRLPIPVLSEVRSSQIRGAPFLICGGGYLNGHWRFESIQKLARLLAHSRRARSTVAHAVELRNLGSPARRLLASQLLRPAQVSVRDEDSAAHALTLGLDAPTVVPDAISLLAPSLERYVQPTGVARGKVLLNLLDISARADRREAQLDLAGWREFCANLVGRLGSDAIALEIGREDGLFAQEVGASTIVRPNSVTGLVSLLHEARGLLSVRMHPLLIATMLGTPSVGVPYTGKVAPTLRSLGVNPGLLVRDLNVEGAMDLLATPWHQSSAWIDARANSTAWLSQALSANSR